jgi:tetratricopeptide (TPR) repeat protein
MKAHAAFLIAILAAPHVRAAGWIQISSPNFDLLTDASEGAGRKTLVAFEQARDFFLREQPSLAGSPPRATIIGFGDYMDYRPFSARPGSLAYHFRDAQGEDYIVISELGVQSTRIAIHEFVHLLVGHSGLSIPVWLNEGMAEVYSTLEERDGKLALGAMKADRLGTLADGNWMHLPALFGVSENSPEYNEQDRAGMFYAESCALAHMLMLGDGYTDKFARLLERISATGSTQTAFADTYGKPVSEIEKELRAYFFLKVQGGAVYEAAVPKVEIGDSRPLGDVEVGITLANLSMRLGHTGQARMRLMDLQAKHPRNGEIDGALAYLDEGRDDRSDSVLERYRAVLALRPAGWRVYWNYARALDVEGGDITARIQALEGALERKPDLAEARLLLGMDLCSAGRYSDALATFRQAPRVERDRAVAMFAGMALAAFGMKQVDDARRYADQARSAARTPEEKAAVERLFTQFKQSPSSAPSVEAPPPAGDDPGRPTLRRNSPPPPAKKG